MAAASSHQQHRPDGRTLAGPQNPAPPMGAPGSASSSPLPAQQRVQWGQAERRAAGLREERAAGGCRAAEAPPKPVFFPADNHIKRM